ncbi:phosphotransferase [Tengunoibacter tsumagoiensis]|uniref:Aminoglycoside phosphotransferase n=1 Tax=Tengunoibacter tsumagoiensis TaxID=2014871 RepID=A0A402A9M1_9CHLR|nr:phosphotransferase [Tengunoibacter tsumagoiensis]GCE15655.1 aminoglycoside phosphotransferase [Tengunoibacter tsumagoiensis]
MDDKNTFIAVPEPLTPQWLTTVLRLAGVLQEGEVRSVEIETTGAFNSQTNHLFLRYSEAASVDAPRRLILKQNGQSTWEQEAGMEEVKFYQLVASLPDHPSVIIPCYAAASDEQRRNSYILLQDLSETHRPPVTRDQQISLVEGVPAAADIEAVIETLAQIHAYWWDHPLLRKNVFDVGYWSRNAERFDLYLRRRRNSWESLLAHEQAWFPGELRELYEQVLDHVSHHWKQYLEPRFREMRNLTLVHGDSYFANFLSPKKPGTGVTYLLDWQSPTVDIAGYDLANLCAAFWTPEQRNEQQREEKMLRHYHTVLQKHGVTNYSWDDLLTDYRTGLIFWLLMPVQDGSDGAGKEYWWPKMHCLVAAFQEWDCHRLL